MPQSPPPGDIPLPLLAQEFLAGLRTNLKHSTCQNYATCLRRFHCFLIKNGINIKNLSRKHIGTFLASLVGANLSPATRRGITVNLRVYLQWLCEREIIQAPSHELVRNNDLPKLPTYLPRPLPAETDSELQKRLRASDSIYHKGLLLMRHTGIRIGELAALPYDCVYTDSRKINFLNVPLGKLDNERNVPLDKNTYNLLKKIQCMEPRKRAYLMPRGNRRTALGQQNHIMITLRQIAAGIKTDTTITSHRLRHTYATWLLNAGVTIPSLMKLLGHRDYRMTLRYAGVTQEGILSDYLAAIKTLDYAAPLPTADLSNHSKPDPLALLDETKRLLKQLTAENQFPAAANASILKKLTRLKIAISQALRDHHQTAKLAR